LFVFILTGTFQTAWVKGAFVKKFAHAMEPES